MGVDLKPCPFCGSANINHGSAQISEDYEEAWVECEDCGAQNGRVEDNYADHATAAAAWNRRSPDWSVIGPELADALADLVENKCSEFCDWEKARDLLSRTQALKERVG